MKHTLTTAALAALHRAIIVDPDFAGLTRDALRPLPSIGLAHDHFRLGASGWLARAPKQSQFGFGALDNLRYQAACFQRASASGHAPRLKRLIPPQPDLPMGALVVEYIAGRAVHMPEELRLLAPALATLHSLPLPSPDRRLPLLDGSDAVAAELRTIDAQAKFLPSADLHPDSQAQFADEMYWARRFAVGNAGQRQPCRLIATDAHPGNWLVRDDGHAVLVDWEKGQYSSPAVDLAHASLYTSTTWDVLAAGAPTLAMIADFYQIWLDHAEPRLAAAVRPWLLPLRRLVWLRALTWCAKWRVASRRTRRSDTHGAASNEDWSADNSDAALVAHVKNRVDHYLDPATMAEVRREWATGSPLGEL
jgi:hypothetical protein